MKLKVHGIVTLFITAIVFGLAIPLSTGFVYSVIVERSRIESRRASFHDEILNALSQSVQDSLLTFAPNEVENAAMVIFPDQRVLSIHIYSTLYGMYFARLEKHPDRGTSPVSLRKEIIIDGENIGYVEVTIDAEFFYKERNAIIRHILLLFTLMLSSALAIILPIIYFKILRPISLLTRQAEILSMGNLDSEMKWKGNDELSLLGKTFEDMRQKLLASFTRIHELAVTDELTGLANRRAFLADANKALEMNQRYEWPLTLSMIDIDHFKKVNDALGHAAGDAVLREFANIVSSMTRKVDIFARIGGEEFALCMPKTSLSDAANVAEKIRERLESHVFPHGLTITGSFGLAEHRPGQSLETLMENADAALYSAKTKGRNCVVLHAQKP